MDLENLYSDSQQLESIFRNKKAKRRYRFGTLMEQIIRMENSKGVRRAEILSIVSPGGEITKAETIKHENFLSSDDQYSISMKNGSIHDRNSSVENKKRRKGD